MCSNNLQISEDFLINFASKINNKLFVQNLSHKCKVFYLFNYVKDCKSLFEKEFKHKNSLKIEVFKAAVKYAINNKVATNLFHPNRFSLNQHSRFLTMEQINYIERIFYAKSNLIPSIINIVDNFSEKVIKLQVFYFEGARDPGEIIYKNLNGETDGITNKLITIYFNLNYFANYCKKNNIPGEKYKKIFKKLFRCI